MILHVYFARRFLNSFLLLAAILSSLVLLIDMVEQIRRFRSVETLGFTDVLWLSLLATPKTMNTLMPLIVILATVMLFLGLARSSELVVTRAAGRSALRALIAPSVVALGLGVVAVSMLNPIAAATSNRYEQMADTLRTGGGESFSLSAEGLWMRQGGGDGQTVIHARRASADGQILYDVVFLTFTGESHQPVRRINASSAQLTDGAWLLRRAKLWPLDPSRNPEANAELHERISVPTSLTLAGIRDRLGDPSDISFWDFPEFVAQLERAGFSTLRHRIWYQSELARPLFLVAMVLVGAVFTMRHARFGGTGIAVAAAVMMGFGLYFIRNFAQILGENGQLPVLLAAWAPPVAAMLLALGLLLHLEDG